MAKKKSSSKKAATKKSATKKSTTKKAATKSSSKAYAGKSLVVVEAPGKVSKIQGYLGPNYIVRASVGHIMDLPPKKLGVDVDNDYAPTYEVMKGKEEVVEELKDIASKVNTAIICSVVYDEPTLIEGPDGVIELWKVGEFIDGCLDRGFDYRGYSVLAHNKNSGEVVFEPIKRVIRHVSPERLFSLKTKGSRQVTVTESHSVFTTLDCTLPSMAFKKGTPVLVPTCLPQNEKGDNSQISRIDVLACLLASEKKELLSEHFIKYQECKKLVDKKAFSQREGEGPLFEKTLQLSEIGLEKLINLRIERGLSQGQIGKALENISQSNISYWESGKANPTLSKIQQYLAFFGTTLEEAFETEDYKIIQSRVQTRVEKALTIQARGSNKSLQRENQPLTRFSLEELGELSEVTAIYNHNGKPICSRFIECDESFFEVLGYYSAEGTCCDQSKHVMWNFGPREHADEQTHIEKVLSWVRKTFLGNHISNDGFASNSGVKICVTNLLAQYLFKDVFALGQHAFTKKVPSIVFSATADKQLSYLRGIFLGDGSLSTHSFTFNTISPQLAEGLRYLLLQNGMTSGLEAIPPAKSETENLTIEGKHLSYRVSISGNKETFSQIIGSHYRYAAISSQNKQQETNGKFIYTKRTGAVAEVSLREKEERPPTKQYVYDFEVEGHTFIAGSGAVCLHNSDEDREGEFIGYSVAMQIKRQGLQIQRAKFNSITKAAIQKAIASPTSLDRDLVRAQQGRRILDRLVGFKVSPLLWSSIRKGLSAGRVQSVGLRIVVDRQKEIDAFKPEDFWTVHVEFSLPTGEIFEAQIPEKFKVEADAKAAVKKLKAGKYAVKDIQAKKTKKSPAPPFTTSAMVQQANTTLGWGAKRTNAAAQKLYEGGFITYIRTDSTVMDPQAVTDIRTHLGQVGANYLPAKAPIYKNKASAQEAHEAIRPTDFNLTSLQGQGLPDEVKLYEMIYKRAIASQSTPAQFDRVTVKIENSGIELTAKGQTLTFDGYLKFWTYSDTKEVILPQLTVGQSLIANGTEKSKKHTTKPPPRYNTASIIKELEETGVGRPSTYQSIIETLLNRNYIVMDGKAFVPTEIGKEVAATLEEFMPRVVDIRFTAQMEEKLDEVAAGKLDWVAAIDFFWAQFAKEIQQASKDLAERMGETEHVCTKCGAPLVRRVSSGGPFYACTNVDPAKVKSKKAIINNTKGKPFCGQIFQIGENKEPVEKKEEVYDKPCPTCGAHMVKKTARRGGTSFWGCSNYALTGCKTSCSLDGQWKIPSAAQIIGTCDKCGKGNMVVKKGRRGPFQACDRYPKCKNAKSLPPDFDASEDSSGSK